jgi:AraC family transcriptional regulator
VEPVQTESATIRGFLRGVTSMHLSSHRLRWKGFVLEEHEAPPQELPETKIDCTLLKMWVGSNTACGEILGPKGSYRNYANRPGTMTLYSPGAVPPVRVSTTTHLLLCAFENSFLQQIAEELKAECRGNRCSFEAAIAGDQPQFYDAPVSRMLNLLRDEATTGGLCGPLYAEHLAHALALRLLTITHNGKSLYHPPIANLSSSSLRRTIERIEANPAAQFDLSGLAAENGYSKAHFLRIFRAATGLAPHQYIVRRRLERAKQLMRKRSLTLLDIALESGFASDAHLSKSFRQHFGVNPSEFRRAL